MRKLVPFLVLLAACEETPTGTPPRTTDPAPLVTASESPFHIFGYAERVGSYDTSTAIEVVAASGEPVAIVSVLSGTRDASMLSLSLDGLRGRAELISSRTGNGAWLPLTLWTGGREHMRLRTDGGLTLSPGPERPACDDEARGTMWFARSDTGDGLFVCRRDGAGVHAWVSVAH